MPAKDEPVVIKKYANRRLYNTGTSTYVTLEDLAEMVKKGEEFGVQDAKSGEDITHSVLTQIIFELENKNGQNMLPVSFLRQLIAFYGDQMQMIVPSFLEQSMIAFAKEQERFREQLSTEKLADRLARLLRDAEAQADAQANAPASALPAAPRSRRRRPGAGPRRAEHDPGQGGN